MINYWENAFKLIYVNKYIEALYVKLTLKVNHNNSGTRVEIPVYN